MFDFGNWDLSQHLCGEPQSSIGVLLAMTFSFVLVGLRFWCKEESFKGDICEDLMCCWRATKQIPKINFLSCFCPISNMNV